MLTDPPVHPVERRDTQRGTRVFSCMTGLLAAVTIGSVALAAHVPVSVHSSTATPLLRQTDYEMAWKTFLGAGQLDDAMALAQKMIARYPESALWHRRLATSAEQNAHAVVAAQQYGWLAMHGQAKAYLQHAIDLAVGTEQDDLAIDLFRVRAEQEPFSKKNWHSLVDALLNGARFQQALDLLVAADHAHPRRFFLQQEAYVDQVIGDPAAQADVLKRDIARYGPEPEASLQLATLQYIQGKDLVALHTLKQAQARADVADTAYWQTLGSLAWSLQDRTAAAHAASLLVQSGKATAEDYHRLYALHLPHSPALAYGYAFDGWRRTHVGLLFFDTLNALDKLDKPGLLQTVFDTVRASDRPELEAHAEYWIRWATLAQRQGEFSVAKARYLQALQREPESTQVLTSLIWFLVDRRDVTSLARLVGRVDAQHPQDDPLRTALASAWALLREPSRALHLISSERSHADAGVVASSMEQQLQLADLYDQVGGGDQGARGDAIRRHVASMLVTQKSTQSPPTLAEIQQRGEVVLSVQNHLAPGDRVRREIAMLGKRAGSKSLKDHVLAWTFDQHSPEATALWLQRHYVKGGVPSWAQLSQSLLTDNDSKTADLLDRSADLLSRRARVTAADKLGWHSLAISWAYAGLQGEPDDRELERTFQGLAIRRSNSVGAEVEGLRGSGLSSIASHLRGRVQLSPALSLDVDAYRTQQHVYDRNQLGYAPRLASAVSGTLTQQLHRGERGLIFGGGHDLDSYGRLGAFYRWQPMRSVLLGLSADYGARSDDTEALAMAGLSDRVRASANYQLSVRDSLSAAAQVAQFRAQGGGYLGARQSLDLGYQRALWLAPPSIALIASVSESRYQRARHLPVALRRLIPVGAAYDTSFFIPRSFTQACLGAGVNEDAREGWRGSLMPYASAGICSNSVAGTGFNVTAGLVTPVLGPDRLGLDLGFSNNTGPQASRTLTASLSYRYYFTP